MDNPVNIENAVAAIRVSSAKQGTDGDSPEAQKEQIERFAKTHNINIKKFFIFMESASKEQQPMQEAVDYCKNPKNDIQLFVIKSIDRFTRGGSYSYDHLKMQLERYGVKLIDIYGVISSQKINTLEHLGVSFDWSVYSPTKKAEILEAERAKDEMRDIMSRMIGAEIRYARMGYWVREAPIGYVLEKIETPNGKRCILKPHPIESKWIIKMFELRSRGNMGDHQIVDEINKLGFKTHIDYVRDPRDRTKIIKEHGGNPLNIKGFWRYIENPIYAGVNTEKWNNGVAVKCKFSGLVSIETFNQANKGKRFISEENGEIKIFKKAPPEYLVKKGVRNPDFPYRKIVMCPQCERPLIGSATKGRWGKYYSAYHCDKRGHYFRVRKEEFNKTVERFIKTVDIAPGYSDALVSAVKIEWEKRESEIKKDVINYEAKITELKTQVKMTVDKIRMLTSEVAIKYLEEDIERIEQQIAELKIEKEKVNLDKPIDMNIVMDYIKYFLDNKEYLLLHHKDPVLRANAFSILFDEAPTYDEINYGTPNLASFIKLNEVFKSNKGKLAAEHGFEP
jgi:site-specific DNA recombinase